MFSRRRGGNKEQQLVDQLNSDEFTDGELELYNSDSDDEEETTIEEAWHVAKIKMNLDIGAKTVALISVILGFEHMYKYGISIWHGPYCEFDTLPEEGRRSITISVIEVVCLFALAPTCHFISINSRHQHGAVLDSQPVDPKYLYSYGVIIFLISVYVLMLGLPPWVMNCDDTIKFVVCANQTEFARSNQSLSAGMAEYLNVLDCSLQGYSMVQFHMMWILASPRLMPSLAWMQFNWFWIFVMNLGTSLYFRSLQENNYYTLVDLAMTQILLCIANAIAWKRKFYIVKAQKKKFMNDYKQKTASEKMFCILSYMVPDHVIPRMLQQQVVSDYIDKVSILFIMIVEFDEFTNKLPPEEVLRFLNDTFSKCDRICRLCDVTKIETVGEEYVAATGVSPTDQEILEKQHSHSDVLGRLVRAGGAMLSLQHRLHIAGQEFHLQFKMGIHTGSIVAGVIGKKLPRFRLFGDTINTAARMMQKGQAGELQFGTDTKDCLPEWVKVKPPRIIELKGKGEVTAYFLDTEGGDYSQFCPVDATPKHKKTRFDSDEQKSTPGSFQLGHDSQPDMTSPLVRDDRMNSTKTFRTARTGTHIAEQRASYSRGTTVGFKSESSSNTSKDRKANKRPSASPQFKKMLDEFSKQFTEDESVGLAATCCAGVCSKIEETDEKKKEMEKGYQKWYHETVIFHKFAERLDRQELGVAIMTAVEVMILICTGTLQRETRSYNAASIEFFFDRLPFFLWTRTACFIIIFAWRMSSTMESVNTKIKQHPYTAQVALLLSWMAIASLWVLSYDSLSYHHEFWDKDYNDVQGLTEKISNRHDLRLANFFSLMIFPAFAVACTQHSVSYVLQLGFVLEVAILGSGIGNLFGRNLVMPISPRITFFLDNLMTACVAASHERAARARYKSTTTMQDAHDRIQSILNTLMPSMILEEMRNLPPKALPPSHSYAFATIAQSDLVGFTKLASTCEPKDVVIFMDELFGKFDELTDLHGVYKVETVGDAYIAGQAEFPLTPKNQPTSVVSFGIDMVQKTQEWAKNRNWSVNCRVGVHTGECIGGIIGTGMQRYHLFGHLMTGVEVLESTAPEGMVQVSNDCYEATILHMRMAGLPGNFIKFSKRKDEKLKTSKGEVHDYSEVGGVTYVTDYYLNKIETYKT